MKLLFVDTAGWMACADESDPAHRWAVAVRDAWLEGGGFFVTSDHVADETLTLLRIRLGIEAAEAWWRQVDDSPRVRWEYVTLARADKARTQFFRYRDKDFSFTDCTSFVLMRELKLREALTTDHHFVQAGFGIKP
ncbi:MAG: PIN domain-containing protein [Verrucomicrobia bacterium]|nr:PIN domain-containing protein [Verrucomicrobiota bacterium]